MTVTIQVTLQGADQIKAALTRVSAGATTGLSTVLESAGALLLDPLQKYPPAPGGSRYRRTGTLGRTWTSRAIAGPGREIGNSTSYAVYVQGPQQAHMHRGRWQNVTQILTQTLPRIQKLFDDYFGRLLG